MPPIHRLRFFRSTSRFVATILATLSAARAAEWQGTVNSRFSEASNWSGGAPQPNTHNAQAGDFKIVNESLSPLRYTAAEGETIIGSPSGGTGQFIVGVDDRSGRLEITGGSLRIYSYWSPIVAQNGRDTTGTIHLSAGLLRISNTTRTKPEERFFRVGNTAPKPDGLRANGALFISGGAMVIECEGGTDKNIADGSVVVGGLNIGRGNGSGLIYITGGILRVTSPNGTSFVADNGRASGILTIGLGDGVFEQTSSSRVTFGNNPDSDSYITFTAGSKGALSLSGAAPETFETLVHEGRIRIDGGTVEMSRFSFSREEGQGILRLASAVRK